MILLLVCGESKNKTGLQSDGEKYNFEKYSDNRRKDGPANITLVPLLLTVNNE